MFLLLSQTRFSCFRVRDAGQATRTLCVDEGGRSTAPSIRECGTAGCSTCSLALVHIFGLCARRRSTAARAHLKTRPASTRKGIYINRISAGVCSVKVGGVAVPLECLHAWPSLRSPHPPGYRRRQHYHYVPISPLAIRIRHAPWPKVPETERGTLGCLQFACRHAFAECRRLRLWKPRKLDACTRRGTHARRASHKEGSTRLISARVASHAGGVAPVVAGRARTVVRKRMSLRTPSEFLFVGRSPRLFIGRWRVKCCFGRYMFMQYVLAISVADHLFFKENL